MRYGFLLLFFFPTFLLRAQEDLTVYVFIAEECPISIFMAKPMKRLTEEFPTGVKYIAVFPTSNSRDVTAQKFLSSYDLENWNILIDRDQTIAKRLGATITPEAVITNANAEILYRGRINDAYYAPGKMGHRTQKDDLPAVLTKLRNGEAVPKPWPAAIGCFITFRSL